MGKKTRGVRNGIGPYDGNARARTNWQRNKRCKK